MIDHRVKVGFAKSIERYCPAFRNFFRMKMAKDKFENITDDELVDEVRNRNLEDNFKDDDDDTREDIEEEVEQDYERNHYVLPKDFDRFQLRDHLCDITRLGSYVSDEKLFNAIRDLLEFS